MTIPEPTSLYPNNGLEFSELVSQLRSSAGIYLLALTDAEPHLAWSPNLPRRLKRVCSSGLRPRLARIDCWETGSKLESSLLMYALARRFFPLDYERRLRLRIPWFLCARDNDGYPRLALTHRVARGDLSLWGPFPTRDAAEYYQEEVLRLHQIRRCTDTLRPSPEHPGCIYGEMNQCVRPCQCAVSQQEYAAEFARVTDFVASNGKAALSTLTAARAAASEEMDFEQAAQIHKRIDQIKTAVAAREDFISEIGSFHGVALTAGATAGEVRLWPVFAAIWQHPITLDVSLHQAESKSLDSELKLRLSAAWEARSADGDPFESLSLFLRWYRSSWRDGTWVGFASLGAVNYRRLVREISKLAREPRQGTA